MSADEAAKAPPLALQLNAHGRATAFWATLLWNGSA